MGEAKRSRGPDFWLPIGVAAVALVGVAVMVAISWPRTERAPASSGPVGFAPPPAAPPVIQQPRALADQMFNRAMMAHESGQTQRAAALIAEAIAAYQQLEPLDADGLFHLAALQLAAGDDRAARVSANRILINAPDHLLGLVAAAQASEESAPQVAVRLWQHYLDVYDAQQGREPEYTHHQQMFPATNERARAFIASARGAAPPP